MCRQPLGKVLSHLKEGMNLGDCWFDKGNPVSQSCASLKFTFPMFCFNKNNKKKI